MPADHLVLVGGSRVGTGTDEVAVRQPRNTHQASETSFHPLPTTGERDADVCQLWSIPAPSVSQGLRRISIHIREVREHDGGEQDEGELRQEVSDVLSPIRCD